MARFNMGMDKKLGIGVIFSSIVAIFMLLSVHIEKELFYSYGEDIVGEWRWTLLKYYKFAALPLVCGTIYATIGLLKKASHQKVIRLLNLLAIAYAIFITALVVRLHLMSDIDKKYEEQTRTIIVPGANSEQNER